MVGADAARYLDDPRPIALDDAELAEASPARPYWDRRLASNRALLDGFIRELDACGLITYRRRVAARCGMFFVRKKSGQLRLVVDARPANAIHRRAPYTKLATTGAVGSLIHDPAYAAGGDPRGEPSWVAAAPAGEGSARPSGAASCAGPRPGDEAGAGSRELWGASIDLQDGFYQFLVPSVSHYFALGIQQTAGSVGIVYHPDLGEDVSVSDDTIVETCFAGLPMG